MYNTPASVTRLVAVICSLLLPSLLAITVTNQFTCAAASHLNDLESHSQPPSHETPIFYLFQYPSKLPPDVKTLQPPRQHPWGLQLAVWSDGFVLFANDFDQPGKDLRYTTLSKDKLAALVEDIKSSGVMDVAARLKPTSSGSEWGIYVRIENSSKCLLWDESLSPLRAENQAPTQEWKNFIRVWFSLRLAGCRAFEMDAPVADRNASGGTFLRGYRLAEPMRTSWLFTSDASDNRSR